MEKFAKDELLTKIDELISLIKEMPTYKRYIDICNQMKKNKEITNIISNIKKKQKEAVNLEYRKENTSVIDKEIEVSLKTLMEYPIYQEYSYLQEDLNNMFQTIRSILENHINEKIK